MTRSTAPWSWLAVAAVVAANAPGLGQASSSQIAGSKEGRAVRIRLLAVGDVNLGRSIGQRLLAGDTLYPFALVRDTLATYDLVFGNLESCLSDQHGETQDPRNNLVFTGPPAGAFALQKGGVQIVSTANNHALDYGVSGWGETMEALHRAGVEYVGTARDTACLSGPTIVVRGGIRIAFFACTDLMNRPGEGWKRYVAAADTTTLLRKIRQARKGADIVVVSYHGGDEYAQRPTRRAAEFARAAVTAGAALVLGHHPHVPYGIETWGKGIIVHSLGNFVFRQPARFWTEHSFALSATVVKDSQGARIEKYAVLPVGCAVRPTFDVSPAERDSVLRRVRMFSSPDVTESVQ